MIDKLLKGLGLDPEQITAQVHGMMKMFTDTAAHFNNRMSVLEQQNAKLLAEIHSLKTLVGATVETPPLLTDATPKMNGVDNHV